ncbi:hypothetical protein QCA50_005646 [Cerrena zonata]|uniref:Uncharacterized protein n=1 Tax=Cerrena zonata TaxID=2478898 RepID=A0AAW0GA84_9APHY
MSTFLDPPYPHSMRRQQEADDPVDSVLALSRSLLTAFQSAMERRLATSASSVPAMPQDPSPSQCRVIQRFLFLGGPEYSSVSF